MTQPLAAIRDGLVALDARDPTARAFQVGQIALLVGHPALLQDVQLRVLAHRPLHEARRGRELERSQMLAGEEADEIRGREDGLAADELHVGPDPGPIRMPRKRSGRGPLRPLRRARTVDQGHDRMRQWVITAGGTSWPAC